MKPQPASPAAPKSAPLPREHGAWGLLLQPFVAAAILAGTWNVALIPAFGFVFAGFLIREPLLIVFRLRKHGSSHGYAKPLRWFAGEALLAGLSFAALVHSGVPIVTLAALVAFGAAFTGLAVRMAVQNRQRSTFLQLAAVGGLSASAFAAVLALRHEIPPWTWWLWTMVTLHGVASVLCVHARLEARIAAAKGGNAAPSPDMLRQAYAATILQGLAAIPAAILTRHWLVALPFLFSSAAHAWELLRFQQPVALRERLQTVGFRMLGVSIVHTLLAIWALWKLAASS